MKIEVTIKTFEIPEANGFIPFVAPMMENAIKQLIRLPGQKPMEVDELNTVHFVDDYLVELKEFQKQYGTSQYVTNNKLGRGHAIVEYLGDNAPIDLKGYHIFVDKAVPQTIVLVQQIENNKASLPLPEEQFEQLVREKKEFLRMLRHELAHVEDGIKRRQLTWIQKLYHGKGIENRLNRISMRLWEEYYACKRSSYYYDVDGLGVQLSSMMDSLWKAEDEICELRWQYNSRNLDLDDFIEKFYIYLQMALIYCCYYCGHADDFYDELKLLFVKHEAPSRFYKYIPRLWEALRNLYADYPEWPDEKVLSETSAIILDCVKEFEVFPRDEDEGIYYEILPKRLKPRLEVAKEKTQIED